VRLFDLDRLIAFLERREVVQGLLDVVWMAHAASLHRRPGIGEGVASSGQA
jgi:hypothetical protein